MVAQVLEATGLDPRRLHLEITENTAMDDVDFTVDVLRRLRGMGVQIASEPTFGYHLQLRLGFAFGTCRDLIWFHCHEFLKRLFRRGTVVRNDPAVSCDHDVFRD